jgi:monoamine oxidase
LFGFIGVPPTRRVDEHLLKRHLKAQFVRLFGPEAAKMNELYVKDWAFDPQTATQADKDPIYSHPTYGLPEVMTNQFDGALYFAGAEVASEFGGYMEGALAAAEDVLSVLR